ncbi:hypothetical protein BGX30_002501, partial [Mortierella sp. GBA39]
ESLHTWNAVIHFSARHLFCPAHAHTHVQAATPTATTTYNTTAAVSRIRRSGSGGGGGHLHPSRHTTAATRTMTALSLPGSNRTVSSQGAASFVLRKLSTAVSIDSNNDPSVYSSGYDHQRSLQDTHFRREPIAATAPSRSSRSGSVTPGGEGGQGRATSHSAHISTPASPKQYDKDEPTPPAQPSTKQTHIKSSSWRFPTKGSGSQFSSSDDNDSNPFEPVQSWTSTANALSELYKSLHRLGSSSSSSFKPTTITGRSSSVATLQSALINYSYLSRLQSMYDTILIPRRHTRTLFLLLGREPKTRDNLEQLLRITTDLIWLNEKERQKKRRYASKLASTPLFSTGLATSNSGAHPQLYNPADDYHGLRVSEYTTLMNWIGSVTSTLGTNSSPAANSAIGRPSASSATTAANTTRSIAATPRYQHPIALSGPVDQAWAIWQDFLLTGMKPDIVLYTMLMDTLLKAKEFERADQIWNHMQSQGSSTASTNSCAGANGSFKNRSVTAGLGVLSSPRSPSSTRLRNHLEATSPRSNAVVPNLQTLSVMMQSHIQESDIDGVTRTYKQLHQTTLHREQQRPINTVLVNQILKVLVDLGETRAAKEIFSEMQVDGGDIGAGSLGLGSSHEEKYTNNDAATASTTSRGPAVFSTPTHHQTSRRRASWKRDHRKRPSSFATSTMSDTSTAGMSIQPNEATYRLMLQVARREMDSDLEGQVLKELRCLPLPSSFSESPK